MRAWIQEIVAIVIVLVGLGLGISTIFGMTEGNGFNGLKLAVGILVAMLGHYIQEKNDFISY